MTIICKLSVLQETESISKNNLLEGSIFSQEVIFHILLYLSSQMRMAEWQCHLWHLSRHAGKARHFGPLKYRIVRRRSPCALPGNRLWRWWTISSPKVSQFLWWRVGGPGWSPRGSNWQAQAVFDWVRIEMESSKWISLRDTCPL